MKRTNGVAGRKPAHHEIAAVAYALYLQEGKPEGKDWEHWFNAEGIVENNFGYGANHTEHDFTKDNDLIGKMKIIVQRKDTGEYYHGADRWTRHKTEAHNFATRDTAEDFCRNSQLHDCKIIVHLKESVADVYMPCGTKRD